MVKKSHVSSLLFLALSFLLWIGVLCHHSPPTFLTHLSQKSWVWRGGLHKQISTLLVSLPRYFHSIHCGQMGLLQFSLTLQLSQFPYRWIQTFTWLDHPVGSEPLRTFYTTSALPVMYSIIQLAETLNCLQNTTFYFLGLLSSTLSSWLTIYTLKSQHILTCLEVFVKY